MGYRWTTSLRLAIALLPPFIYPNGDRTCNARQYMGEPTVGMFVLCLAIVPHVPLRTLVARIQSSPK